VHARHSIVFTPRGRVYALVGVLVSRRTRTRISPKANPTRPRPHGDIFRTLTGGITYADLKDRPSALTAGRKAGHTFKLRSTLRHTMDKTRRRVDSFKIHTGQSRTPAHAGQRLLIRRPPISTDGRSEGGVITFPRLFSMEEETSTTMLYDGRKYSSSPPFTRWRPSSQEELKAGFSRGRN
jgi:hypothetical protein